MTVLAAIGAKALWLLYAWLASAIVASYLSERKGYGSKLGLAFGLLLSVVGAVIWLLVPGPGGLALEAAGPVREAAARRSPRRAPSASRRRASADMASPGASTCR